MRKPVGKAEQEIETWLRGYEHHLKKHLNRHLRKNRPVKKEPVKKK